MNGTIELSDLGLRGFPPTLAYGGRVWTLRKINRDREHEVTDALYVDLCRCSATGFPSATPHFPGSSGCVQVGGVAAELTVWND